MDSTVWRKPNRVVVQDGYLIADFAAGRTYPLLDSVKKSRALRLFSEASTDDRAEAFTTAWGFLHFRFENGRADRYPLELFQAKRQQLLALTRLMNVLCARQRVERALADLKEASAMVQRATPGIPTGDRLPLTSEERRWVEAGVPPFVVVEFRGRTRVTLVDAAARTLAAALDMPHRFSIEKAQRQWSTTVTPLVDSLETALRWTLRAGFGGLHHRVCESCGTAWIAGRPDTRFCTETCGSRERVRRHRRRKSTK